jgi:predicted site-specific integrase-resolvase
MTERDDEKWMTVEEVMSYLQIARSTLSKYQKDGKLKPFQRGRRTYYLREQVLRLGEPKPKNPNHL